VGPIGANSRPWNIFQGQPVFAAPGPLKMFQKQPFPKQTKPTIIIHSLPNTTQMQLRRKCQQLEDMPLNGASFLFQVGSLTFLLIVKTTSHIQGGAPQEINGEILA